MNTPATPRSSLTRLFARTGSPQVDDDGSGAGVSVAASPGRTAWAIVGIVLAGVSAILVFYGVLFTYMSWSAERDSRTFCGSIPIGSDVATAIERFEKRDSERNQWLHSDQDGGHLFTFPAGFDATAYCEVSLDAKGRVVDKKAMLYD